MMSQEKQKHRKSIVVGWIMIVMITVVIYLVSSFSKVQQIQIVGNQFLHQELVIQASGILIDENFFLWIPQNTIKQQIQEKIPVIENIHLTRKWPQTIEISLELKPHVAYEVSEDGSIVMIFEDMTSWKQSNPYQSIELPILSNWMNDNPYKSKLCQVLSRIDREKLIDISEIVPSPSISYPDKILMYTNSQFEVYTTISYLEEKINYLEAYITSIKKQSNNRGVIIMLEVDSYSPNP